MPVDELDDPALLPLGAGERAAIALALSLKADLILIDERRAARRNLVDLADSFARLKRTNFRYRQQILDALSNQQSRQPPPS